jgi:CBS domain containing-hemolysin-like protein
LGWIGENTLSAIVEQAIAAIPLPLGTSHALAVPLAFFLLVYLQIVLGELCPKSVALIYAEQLARFLGPPIGAIARIFHPFIWILNQSTRWLLQLVGIRPTQWGWHTRVTPEELQLIIETEGESTGLEAGERQLLSNVFEFGDVTAVEVMVPRLRVVAISEGAVLADLLQQIAEVGHSRYPVKGESLDDIIGLIDFKDLALPLAQGQIALDTSIDSWVKPVRFVPESMPLNELLALMQRSHLKLVMVVDEYGSTSGLITLEDVIAEIIGDALPGETGEIPELRVLDEQTFLVQAQMNLEELNELLDLDLPLTEEYQTLGGFLLYQWQKIPAPGESLQYDNLEFTVVSAEGRRLCEVRLHRQHQQG